MPRGVAASTLARRREPFTLGVPLPEGQFFEPHFVGRASDGAVLPVQADALDRWGDGSIRWVLLDFQADVSPDSSIAIAASTVDSRLPDLASMDGARVAIAAGPAEFVVGTGRFPFEDARIHGTPALALDQTALLLEGPSNRPCHLDVTRVTIERNGPIRAVVRVDGTFPAEGSSHLDIVARLHFFAGKPCVRFDLTIGNPRRAEHTGGFWELGDEGSVFLRDLSLRVALSGDAAPQLRCSEACGRPLRPFPMPFELRQESSGGEHWDGPVHRNRRGEVRERFQGYRVTSAGTQHRGLRSTPIVEIACGPQRATFAMDRFWENCPKAISGSGRFLTLHLFPAALGGAHELQGGEQKTHTFWLSIGADEVSDPLFDWCRNPSLAVPEPRWSCGTGAVPWLTPVEEDPHPEYCGLVAAAIDGPDSFFAKRERVDEYGWRHFGDAWADHEAVLHEGPQLFVSHYNNQYDLVAGCAHQFIRSGDPRWWTLMDDMARHVVDVDIYHTTQDRWAYNHGLFWHTVHHTDAGLSGHRSYPRAAGVRGGGPSPSHLYTTGLMLHHFLTGDPRSREAVIDLAGFVIDADDGSKSRLRWLDRGPTGLASLSTEAEYHGPGRAPGNAINALVDAHRLSGEARFLDKAGELVRRCIHPRDDITARDLFDVERRWFYTVFLQALGKLLHHLREVEPVDPLGAYARDSLLSYARWMSRHERPYLEKPNILEFPTETWAAQDLRKCDVFNWAALYTDDAERSLFLERSRFFFTTAVTTLVGMPTRSATRPVALLLSHGWSQAAVARQTFPRAFVGPPHVETTSPRPFESQRARVRRRLRSAAMVSALALAASLAIALLRSLFV